MTGGRAGPGGLTPIQVGTKSKISWPASHVAAAGEPTEDYVESADMHMVFTRKYGRLTIASVDCTSPEEQLHLGLSILDCLWDQLGCQVCFVVLCECKLL